MSLGNHAQTQTELGEGQIEHVPNFSYLGSIVTENCDEKASIDNLVRKGTIGFGTLGEIWNSGISQRAKMLAYRSVVRPKVLYAAETIYSTYETDAQLDVFDRSCIRKILKIHWSEYISNEQLKTRVRALLGDWSWLSEDFAKARLRYLGHVLRMEDEELPRKVFIDNYVNLSNGTNRGRPKNCWISTIKSDLKRRGVDESIVS